MEQENKLAESKFGELSDGRTYRLVNTPEKPVKAYGTDGATLLKTFLKATKDWDGVYTAIGIYFVSASEPELAKLIHSARVVLSRYRATMRENGKSFRDFKFKSDIIQTDNPKIFLAILSKEASRVQANASLIEELM